MTADDVTNQLQLIAVTDDFAGNSAKLIESWLSAGAGIETVEPVLRFMEEHPSIEFGMPGGLTHFIERFHGSGYEEKLVVSVQRRPTTHTVWMLNRLINGERVAEKKRPLVQGLEQVQFHPAADQNTLQLAARFLERLSQ